MLQHNTSRLVLVGPEEVLKMFLTHLLVGLRSKVIQVLLGGNATDLIISSFPPLVDANTSQGGDFREKQDVGVALSAFPMSTVRQVIPVFFCSGLGGHSGFFLRGLRSSLFCG